jgi:hypothetical protein
MKPAQRLLRRLSSLLKIPDQAIRMLLATSEVSGLERKTLPRELIPLNTLQLSRGVLNYVALQGLHGWIYPYAFLRQLDPDDPAFIPRAHLSVMMNVTHRNWTAIGNPECDTEPIVDPRGMLTFIPNGWSLDVWVRVGGRLVVPSGVEGVTQKLEQGNPVVQTVVPFPGGLLSLTAFTVGRSAHCRITVIRTPDLGASLEVIAAVRPFNPEGVSLIHTLSYESVANTLRVNASECLRFSRIPERVLLSSFDEGDVALQLGSGRTVGLPAAVECSVGFATGAAVFPVGENEHEFRVTVSCDVGEVKESPQIEVPPGEAHAKWVEYRTGAMEFLTPDDTLNDLFRASLSTVMQLTDGCTITPGPFTYHQFWFRDAAAMLLALDKTGGGRYADRVIRDFPRWQTRSGFYRSQQGEWDANGQALWTVWQHALYSEAGRETAERLLKSMKRGVTWIDRSRVKAGRRGEPVPEGLLPAGLSAEHLGLADYYYWDDFWALAGIRAYIALCEMMHGEEHAESARELHLSFEQSLDRALMSSEALLGRKAIPAGPQRALDCGMIGSIVAVYPLQVLSPWDARVTDTLDVLLSRFFQRGMFFQDFVHSGLNTYLTLQVAHVFLYRREQGEFLKIFREVISRSSPTFSFPEAIHPTTGGGIMGDGHHGWTAAEVVLLGREMFVYEEWDVSYTRYALVLLAGIPGEWFLAGVPFGVANVPTAAGLISLRIEVSGPVVKVVIQLEANDESQQSRCAVCFPFRMEGYSMRNEKEEELRGMVAGNIIHLAVSHGVATIVGRMSGVGGDAGMLAERRDDISGALS